MFSPSGTAWEGEPCCTITEGYPDPLSDVHSWGSKQGSGNPNDLIWLSETPGNAGVDTSQGTQEGSAASMKILRLIAGLLGTAYAVYSESIKRGRLGLCFPNSADHKNLSIYYLFLP